MEEAWGHYYKLTQATSLEQLNGLLNDLPNLGDNIEEQIREKFGPEIRQLVKAVASTILAVVLRHQTLDVEPAGASEDQASSGHQVWIK